MTPFLSEEQIEVLRTCRDSFIAEANACERRGAELRQAIKGVDISLTAAGVPKKRYSEESRAAIAETQRQRHEKRRQEKQQDSGNACGPVVPVPPLGNLVLPNTGFTGADAEPARHELEAMLREIESRSGGGAK